MLSGLVRVHKFWLDVVRRQPGLLQYKICFDLEMPDDCTDAVEDAPTAKLVRLVYEHLLLGLSLEQQQEKLKFVKALRTLRAQPLRPGAAQDPKVAYIIAALEQEARFAVSFEMLEELKGLRDQLREVLLTRNRGVPGDIFLICCHAAFLRQEVTDSAPERSSATCKCCVGYTVHLRPIFRPASPWPARGLSPRTERLTT